MWIVPSNPGRASSRRARLLANRLSRFSFTCPLLRTRTVVRAEQRLGGQFDGHARHVGLVFGLRLDADLLDVAPEVPRPAVREDFPGVVGDAVPEQPVKGGGLRLRVDDLK